jgi:F-box-like
MDGNLELALKLTASTHSKFRNRGDELRYLIETARNHLKSWETELQSYCQSTMSMQKVPVEVLSLIFKHTIRWDPRHIRRLMLVCRRWYQITISDPSLWTDITVKIHQYESDLPTYAEGIVPYLKACLRRSQSMLLHVELDFRSLQSFQSAEHRRLVMMHIKYDYSETDPPSSETEATQQAPGKSLEDHSHIEEILSLLVGEDQKHLIRWGSLDLRLPGKHSVDRQIWASLKGAVPYMKTLSIEGYFHAEIGEFRMGGSIVNNSLCDFQHLTSLRVRKIEDFRKLQVPVYSLIKLDIESMLDKESINALERFVNLRTLRLVYPHASQFLRQNTSLITPTSSSPLRFHLPSLEEIYFLGRYEGLSHVSFQFPSLQQLYVVSPREALLDTLPNIRVPHVHFTVPYTPDDRKRGERARISITKVVRHYHGAESLTVHSPRFDLVDQESNLANLRAKGVIPARLKTAISRVNIGLEWF